MKLHFTKLIELKINATLRFCLCCFAVVGLQYVSIAQNILTNSKPAADTLREVEIIQGNSLRKIIVDSLNRFQTIAGGVKMKEGLTIFTCDSAAINELTKVMESFGNIHINQNDSIHTYAQYLKYIGAERIAYLKKDVKLTDKKGTLFTQELEYDLKTNIGKYQNGGKVVNGKTTLFSLEGVYYADTHDVYFKKNVRLTDPKYDISSDSLLYNTQTQVVTFITATHIKSKEGGDIYTNSGTYDLKNGKAFFGYRTVFKDSTRTYVADNSAYDEKIGIAQLEGNAVIRDSVNGYTILGNQIYLNKKDNSFLATRKPVLIFKGDGNDSTFIAADTLFSGVAKRDSKGNKVVLSADTLKKTTILNEKDKILSIAANKDSSGKIIENSTESSKISTQPDSVSVKINKTDSIEKEVKLLPDSTNYLAITLDTSLKKKDVDKNLLKKDTSVNVSADTAIRFFIAFHHVRIFNDSLQAVCDSLYYTSEDSVFRMFKDPLVFSNKSQISGDTIHLYTKNKKAERVYVFDNGILINEIKPNMYNQMGGRTLNGYFKDGALDYMRVKGSPAESVFYPQDDDSAFTGMNRCKGDVIDVYFVDKAVNKVKFINDVDGTLYPIRQIPDDQKYLNKFKWWESRRPKSKWELFE
jgi:lipopolysaccharide export system protein LptA